jgi:OOP family OmpA-OmpF porin
MIRHTRAARVPAAQLDRTRRPHALLCTLLALATTAFAARSSVAADAPAPPAVAAAPVTEQDPGPFPFLPALEGFDPAPPATSTWIKSTDFARYGFQTGDDQYAEVGGRLDMRHFIASAPGTQSLDKIVESYRELIEQKGGVVLFTGRFTGGLVDANPRSEQQAREGATYLVRTPERELWAQVSVRDEGNEYVLVVLEKGPLLVKTKPLTADELKKSLDATGKAVIYVNFEFDKADLRPDAKPVIDQVDALLKADPTLALSIEGHTDDRGAAAYNQSLSERRAAAVKDALLKRGLGKDGASRLTSTGHGATQPIADNATDDGRAKNRRVELIKR